MNKQNDDWKGEHLIRGVSRTPYNGGGMNMRLVAKSRTVENDKKLGIKNSGGLWRKRQPNQVYGERPVCSTDGCTAILWQGAKSGKCREHMHDVGCRCLTCQKKEARERLSG